MVTIADVAAHAGVGAGTVSRVLNNSPRVRTATRARVLASIESLNYRPNPLARGLSRGRCQTVGVVVPFFTQPSANERLRGVAAALDSSSYDLVLFNVESPEQRDEYLSTLTRRDRADGLLIVSLPPPRDQLGTLRSAGVPIVLVDACDHGVPQILTDDVEGGRMAARLLVQLGHRDIAFIGAEVGDGFAFPSSIDRQKGCREVLELAGLSLEPHRIRHAPHERNAAREAATDLLRKRPRPTAVFASSDVQAFGVVEAARALGLDVPGDVSVIGFDDIEISAYVGLTTVRQPLFASGFIGAKTLLAMLETNTSGANQIDRLPLELMERSTTAPPQRRGAIRRG